MELKKHYTNEQTGIRYTIHGDFYLPDIKVPEENITLGKWGMMHKSYLEKHKKFGIAWNAYDYDPEYLFDFYEEKDGEYGDVMSTHWPNFLRFQPQNNYKVLGGWVKYFKKQI